LNVLPLLLDFVLLQISLRLCLQRRLILLGITDCKTADTTD